MNELLIEERELPFASKKLANGTHIVTSYFGSWVLLTPAEYNAFVAKQWTPALRQKLEQNCIVLTKNNAKKLVQRYVGLNRHLFLQPSLHIINLTNMCNYRCWYCHAGVSQGKEKMSLETAAKVVKWIIENSGNTCTIEFQGGEPLLNWPVLQFITEQARLLNKANKDLQIVIVSNTSLLDDEKLKWIIDNDVRLCTSLDGPPDVHNANRQRIGGGATYDTTVANIQRVNKTYQEHHKPYQVGALATITKNSLQSPKEIVDTYAALGMPVIYLRGLHNLGDAIKNWQTLEYSADEFVIFWKQALEHIISLNKKGVRIMEQGTLNILKKILAFQDPLYIEFMSPTGCGRGTLLYNFDGGIYSSDEGRMIADDIFKIGTVDEPPEDVLGNDNLVNTWAATFMDLYAYHSPFRPWLGTHPVLNYQTFGNMIPRITETFWFKVHEQQCTFVFEKLSDPSWAEIFKNWVLQ